MKQTKSDSIGITWENVPEDRTLYVGMMYEIHEIDTGMIYIGIKKYWRKIKRKPLKGKKRKRIDIVESNWREYVGSCKKLQAKIAKNPSNYRKMIVRNCRTVIELKTAEAYELLHLYLSGNWDKCINEMINIRVRIRKNE